jgi:hypothetical protein
MVEVTRTNPNAFQIIADQLRSLDGKEAKAGFFASAKYEDGTPVAYIATIQEYGAHFTQFGSKAGDYSVVIPPRPFMRPTVARETQNWLDALASGAKAVLAGNMSATDVMWAVGHKAALDIAKTITQITSPPLKPATIAARLRKRADKATVGNLTKPLIDSGKMLESVQNTVEDANAG